MQIDWFTVAAQLFNFLLLAWLLKRFLYHPVIDAMARREERIAGRLAQAAQREQDAQAEAEAFRDRSAALEREREARLGQAREAAEQERRSLVEAAREEARASRERWQQDLDREQAAFREALVRELAQAAVDVARHVLADLADARLESQVIAKLARQVGELPVGDRTALAEAAPRLQLATTFEPEADAVDGLRRALADALGRDVELEAVRKPGLVFGAELRGAGYEIDWSLAGHLAEMADEIRQSLDETRHAVSETTGAPVRGGDGDADRDRDRDRDPMPPGLPASR